MNGEVSRSRWLTVPEGSEKQDAGKRYIECAVICDPFELQCLFDLLQCAYLTELGNGMHKQRSEVFLTGAAS
jgi:hypothetical protein